MPPSNVLFARLSKLSLLCALLVMGLTPGALGAHAYNAQAIGLHAQATNPDISLTPRPANGGYRVAVSGSGFAPHSTITLAVDGSPVSANCTANASGSFSSCAFTPPPEIGGTHTVTASDTSANAAAAMYTASTFAASINPAPPASLTSSGQATNTGDNPTVRLSSGAGKVGSNIAVSGSGFEPHQDITLAVDGSPVATECGTKGDGSFRYCVLTIPAAGVGTHTVTASDDNANSASTGYTVNPGISLTPKAGPVGSRAAVSGSGFAPDSRITLTVGDHRVSSSCTANALGSFSNCAFTVPDVHTGAHIVTASAIRTNVAILRFYHSASALYNVIPGISLNATAANVGDTVRVSGGPFTPHSLLTVSFDGSRLPTSGNCTTSGSGNLPASNGCTFAIPTEATGSYNVVVSDGTYSSTHIFTVTPGVSLSFNEGYVDSNVAVSGSGYASFSAVTLEFGDSTVALTNDAGKACTTDATGTFDGCEFAVPAATAGSHKVTATDANGNFDATQFKVTPSVEVTSGSGTVGSSASVVGDGFKAKDTISVTFDGQGVSTGCKTDASGSLSPCAFTVPATTAGDHKVTLSDGAHSAWVLYTVGPGISLSLPAGVAGSVVTLSGSNFPPNSTLTVSWEDTKVKTSGICTTDASGNLPATSNCAFTVPSETTGSYEVTVSAGRYRGSATFTVNTALTLIPAGGPAGSGATLSGSGFAPDSPIKVTFGDSRVDTACTTDGNGNISFCAFTVPDVHVGTRIVTVKDGSGYAASASFTVEPAISLNLPAGAVGSTITLSGSNFKAGSSLTVTLDGEKLSTSGSCTPDAGGNLNNCAFTVPSTFAGDHTVTVSDGTYSGTASLTVTPAISLSASAGPAGNSVAVSGSGFAPDSPITLSFDGSGVSTSCITDAQGNFSNCPFTVPVRAAALHTVTASDGTNSGTATYTINPSFSLSPSEGPVGSNVAVNGTGFMAFAPIALTFDGSSVATPCQANASGRVSGCTFTVPAAPAGDHKVTVSDGTYSSSATYTVGPGLRLIAGTGAPGSSLTVSGTGFTSGTVTVTFDGSKVSTCDANSNGNINACTFTVPATATAGNHIVAATDKKGSSASAIYNI